MHDLALIQSTTRDTGPAPSGRFDAFSIGLHWTSVLLIAGLFASAWSLGLASDGAAAASLLTLHRSLGVSLGLLAIVRLCWRLSLAVRPPLPASTPPAQRRAAAISEFALYVLLLFQPLTGLAQSVTRGRPFQLFVFEAPKLMPKDKGLTTFFHEVHELTALALLGLIGLHVAAALFHGLVRKDTVLQSMLPWRAMARKSRAGE